MKLRKSIYASTLFILGCAFASAQTSTDGTNVVSDTSYTYNFQTVNVTGDAFTQLLGINTNSEIAGYHGSGATGHPNKGFKLTLPKDFTSENFPGSTQTQVIGINKRADTVGFYVNAAGTHGFISINGSFRSVNFPGSNFDQLLGVNDFDQAAGYLQDKQGNFHPYIYDANGGVFLRLFIPPAVSAQATGINNSQAVSGFYIDSKSVNHGFLLVNGTFIKLDYPHATLTQALGVNNLNEVVGTYNDAAGNTHGFSWQNGTFHSIDDPSGFGSTVVNGVNDHGRIVGFYGNTAGGISNGFVGTPANQ